jgi:hypothetical protein
MSNSDSAAGAIVAAGAVSSARSLLIAAGSTRKAGRPVTRVGGVAAGLDAAASLPHQALWRICVPAAHGGGVRTWWRHLRTCSRTHGDLSRSNSLADELKAGVEDQLADGTVKVAPSRNPPLNRGQPILSAGDLGVG